MSDLIERPTLSVQQPWAWLIVNNYKPLENRTWGTKLRGVINVHAGKKVDHDAIDWVRTEFPDIPLPDSFETGGIVGTVEQHDCVTRSGSPWFFGPFGHLMRNGQPCELIPTRGQLGYFPAFGPPRSIEVCP